MGIVLLSYPLCYAFARNDRGIGMYCTKCDVDVKLLCFRYLNLICNNYLNSDVCEILVNYL